MQQRSAYAPGETIRSHYQNLDFVFAILTQQLQKDSENDTSSRGQDEQSAALTPITSRE